jgi:hypothetical protein
MSQPSSVPGITNPTTTSTGPGSPAQQALANQQANAARQNAANQMAKGGSKFKYKGGAIALAPMQPGTTPSQVALNAQVQKSGSQSAANSQFDCAANNSCPKGGRRRSRKARTNKRKTRRNNKKTKRRRTKGSRK